jgi:hypothetical protein
MLPERWPDAGSAPACATSAPSNFRLGYFSAHAASLILDQGLNMSR